MLSSRRNFIILIAIVLGFGLAFWIRQIRQSHMPAIPDTIIVNTSADYPPFAFQQDNAIVGFDIDVVQEAIKRLGKTIAIKDTPFELLIPQASIGVCHVIAANLAITPEREKLVVFTRPYLTNSPLVVLTLAKNAPINSLND